MNPSDLAVNLDRIARELPAELRRLLTVTALDADAKAKVNATTTLNVRSGRLRASITSSVEQAAGNFAIVLRAGTEGGTVPYARIHEEGGTIRPKKAQFLKIPVGPALTGAGVPRLPARRGAGGRSQKAQSALRFAPTAKGGVLIAPDGQVWYVLRRQVTIPARPYLAPALRAVEPQLQTGLDRLVRAAVEGGR